MCCRPRDAIRVLADQLADAVVVDDLGPQCVTRDTARALFAGRAEARTALLAALLTADPGNVPAWLRPCDPLPLFTHGWPGWPDNE
jgi:hypothetical protein